MWLAGLPTKHIGGIILLYELRIYTIYEGRMDAIQARFKEHTFRIFTRLGIKVVSFWIDAIGQNKLYYVLEYKDMEQRQRLWEQFKKDDEWIQVKRSSEENGGLIVEKIEEYFMHQADFSAWVIELKGVYIKLVKVINRFEIQSEYKDFVDKYKEYTYRN